MRIRFKPEHDFHPFFLMRLQEIVERKINSIDIQDTTNKKSINNQHTQGFFLVNVIGKKQARHQKCYYNNHVVGRRLIQKMIQYKQWSANQQNDSRSGKCHFQFPCNSPCQEKCQTDKYQFKHVIIHQECKEKKEDHQKTRYKNIGTHSFPEQNNDQ